MHLLLVDALNLIRRIYAAAENSEVPLEATRSRCLSAILRTVEQLQTTHLAMVFETKSPTWRHALWPDYKLARAPMPEPLQQNLQAMQHYFQEQGIFCFEVANFEADDVVATLAKKAAYANLKVTIMSTDKGFCQLVEPRIKVLNYFERFIWDEQRVREKYMLSPEQLPDFLGLTGDTTNHLPGVPSIGPKTAGQLLDRFGDLDTLLLQRQQCDSKLTKALTEHWERALLTRLLAKLKLDVDIGVNLHSMRFQSS